MSAIFRLGLYTNDLSDAFFLIDHHRIRGTRRKPYERRRWQVVSVEHLDVVEDVYCCVVDKTHSFVLDDNILTGNCHGCKFRGGVADLVAAVQEVSRSTAERFLRDKYGIEFNEPTGGSMVAETEARFRAAATEPEMTRVPRSWLSAVRVDWDAAYASPETFHVYMIDRGLMPSTLTEFDIGYDYASDRVTIPVIDLDGEPFGVKGRSWNGREPRYLVLGDPVMPHENRPLRYGFHAYPITEVVFGLHRAREYKIGVLVEGELDVLALSQLGVHRPIATGVARLSNRQARLIVDEFDEVVVFYDAGQAGHDGTWGYVNSGGRYVPGAVAMLEPYVRVRVARPLDVDPCDALRLGREGEILATIAAAESSLASNFVFR